MIRIIDILFSFCVLVIIGPIILLAMLLIWLQDFKSPFYMAPRVGRDGKMFKMVKLRSMVSNADKIGIITATASDSRITPLGSFIRKVKLDELTQFWNVLCGTMSIVGPRPQAKPFVDMYTDEEMRMLSAKQGITDFASIVFFDQGKILKDSEDPDLDYQQLIRPWKSKLALVYVDHPSAILELKLIFLTALVIVNRKAALAHVEKILKGLNIDEDLIRVARRNEPLVPTPPPGSDEIYTHPN